MCCANVLRACVGAPLSPCFRPPEPGTCGHTCKASFPRAQPILCRTQRAALRFHRGSLITPSLPAGPWTWRLLSWAAVVGPQDSFSFSLVLPQRLPACVLVGPTCRLMTLGQSGCGCYGWSRGSPASSPRLCTGHIVRSDLADGKAASLLSPAAA